MNWPQIFTSFGLLLDAFGGGVLIFPSLKKTRNIDENLIVSGDKETGNYTQKKHISERKRNLWGLGLLIVGFLLQLLGTVLVSR